VGFYVVHFLALVHATLDAVWRVSRSIQKEGV
jgi:hypothetical protein